MTMSDSAARWRIRVTKHSLKLRAVGADAVLGRRGDLLPERQVLRQVLDLRAVAGLGLAAPLVDDADVQRLVLDRGRNRCRPGGSRSRRPVTERVESMQAEIVAAPFHVGRGERDAERLAQDRQVLEEDLLLEVLRAGRDEHALAAEDRGHEVGERLAGAGAGFGEQDAAVGEDVGDGRRHLELAGARLEAGSASASGPPGAKAASTAAREAAAVSPPSGSPFRVQRELPAQRLDFRPHRRERAVVVGRRERRAR